MGKREKNAKKIELDYKKLQQEQGPLKLSAERRAQSDSVGGSVSLQQVDCCLNSIYTMWLIKLLPKFNEGDPDLCFSFFRNFSGWLWLLRFRAHVTVTEHNFWQGPRGILLWVKYNKKVLLEQEVDVLGGAWEIWDWCSALGVGWCNL